MSGVERGALPFFADGHALKLCDATTGHVVKTVAFCEDPALAECLSDLIAERDQLTRRVAELEGALPSDAVLAEIRGRVDAVPDEPPFSHGAWAIRDRRVLLATIDQLRAALKGQG